MTDLEERVLTAKCKAKRDFDIPDNPNFRNIKTLKMAYTEIDRLYEEEKAKE